MTLAAAVNAAIRVAKSAMGDVVLSGTYRKFSERTYVAGTYTNLYDDQVVDYAPDRFTYEEMQGDDYQISDIKIVVFNTDNVVGDPNPADKFKIGATEYQIKRAEPTKVGNFKPVVVLVLRK